MTCPPDWYMASTFQFRAESSACTPKEEERIATARKALDPETLLLLDANNGPKTNREA